jgi:hypothetical protein
MELYLLIDETNDPVMNMHLDQIHEFIERLLAGTAVGVAYMRNGEASVVQTPTAEPQSCIVRGARSVERDERRSAPVLMSLRTPAARTSTVKWP